MTDSLDAFIKTLPPEVPRGPHRGSTSTSDLHDRIMRQLYLHGPCSEGTLMNAVGERDVQKWSLAMAKIASEITAQTVSLAGREGVRLLYVRGGGVG